MQRTPNKKMSPALVKIILPFQKFLQAETAGGILIMVCAFVALLLANSPWQDAYTEIWNTPVKINIGTFELGKPLLLWINDALMAAFFFVVGLEIKREVLVGELSSISRAMLPLAAALGGMVAPAALYLAFNWGTDTVDGWGVPMATDIAFALGVLALLGNRIDVTAKIFLVALAIVDDIGATLIIALFYTEDVSWIAVLIGLGFWAGQIFLNAVGVRKASFYAILGLGLWLAFLKSGVHPTIAGILGAMSIPSYTRYSIPNLSRNAHSLLDVISFRDEQTATSVLVDEERLAAIESLEKLAERGQTPLQRLEHAMLPWVTYLIMPLFALANAGVTIEGSVWELIVSPVSLGIITGLVLGKQLGVFSLTWLAVKVGLTELPKGVNWRHVYGLSCLSGIGFTMSLFIAGLAFDDVAFVSQAKVGILLASLVSGLGGFLILRRASA